MTFQWVDSILFYGNTTVGRIERGRDIWHWQALSTPELGISAHRDTAQTRDGGKRSLRQYCGRRLREHTLRHKPHDFRVGELVQWSKAGTTYQGAVIKDKARLRVRVDRKSVHGHDLEPRYYSPDPATLQRVPG